MSLVNESVEHLIEWAERECMEISIAESHMERLSQCDDPVANVVCGQMQTAIRLTQISKRLVDNTVAALKYCYSGKFSNEKERARITKENEQSLRIEFAQYRGNRRLLQSLNKTASAIKEK